MKKILLCTLSFLLCALTACGASHSVTQNSAPSATAELYTADVEMASNEAAGAGATTPALPQTRKIILNADLQIETLDFDNTCANLLKLLEENGGYLSSSNLYAPAYEGAQRSYYYEMRIPADHYTEFLGHAGETGNVVSQNEHTQDITSAYVDTESRLKSLRLQEERLFTMMEQAGELETLLAIQNQLTEVQYQIENYTSQMNTYDDLIDYSTICITVQEVKRITEASDNFGQRIGAAFGNSWHAFVVGLQNFIIVLIYLLPFVLLLCVLSGFVIFIWSKRKKRTPKPKA